jgi:methionyl-tRNA synthetase
VNADLANNLGNALNRTLGILDKNFGGVVPAELADYSAELKTAVEVAVEKVNEHMAATELQESLEAIWQLLDGINKYIDTHAPWALAKAGETEKLGAVLYAVLEALRHATILVSPFVPTLAEKMWVQLGTGQDLAAQRWTDLTWGKLAVGTQTVRVGPIYPRIEDELAGAAKQA